MNTCIKCNNRAFESEDVDFYLCGQCHFDNLQTLTDTCAMCDCILFESSKDLFYICDACCDFLKIEKRLQYKNYEKINPVITDLYEYYPDPVAIYGNRKVLESCLQCLLLEGIINDYWIEYITYKKSNGWMWFSAPPISFTQERPNYTHKYPKRSYCITEGVKVYEPLEFYFRVWSDIPDLPKVYNTGGKK